MYVFINVYMYVESFTQQKVQMNIRLTANCIQSVRVQVTVQIDAICQIDILPFFKCRPFTSAQSKLNKGEL